MFHNPTAAVNLFHVGKQYLTFCKAWAAVTHNLIGRKIISNVKHSDARNSLPISDVIRSSDKRHSASKYCKWTLRQTTGVCYTRIYVLGAPSHFPTEYRHEAAVVSRKHRMKWVVVLGDGDQWPLPWECTLHMAGSVTRAAVTHPTTNQARRCLTSVTLRGIGDTTIYSPVIWALANFEYTRWIGRKLAGPYLAWEAHWSSLNL